MKLVLILVFSIITIYIGYNFSKKYKTRDKIAEVLKDRCNELGRLDHTKFNK